MVLTKMINLSPSVILILLQNRILELLIIKVQLIPKPKPLLAPVCKVPQVQETMRSIWKSSFRLKSFHLIIKRLFFHNPWKPSVIKVKSRRLILKLNLISPESKIPAWRLMSWENLKNLLQYQKRKLMLLMCCRLSKISYKSKAPMKRIPYTIGELFKKLIKIEV